MTRLLMIVPAPAIPLPDGRLRLDVKFVEGMKELLRHWDGPVAAVFWATVRGKGQKTDV